MTKSKITAILLVLSAGANVAVAADSELDRATLTGLHGVGVIVERLDAEVERAGLTRGMLQTDAELKLRLAGIQVLTDQELDKEPGHPLLLLTPNILLRSGAFGCSVELLQNVQLIRAPSVGTLAPTWSTSGVGVAPARRVLEDVRNTFKGLVDRFVNAYLAANPKK